MSELQVFEDYGDECPFPFFDEPKQYAEGYYKIYHDGGSYIATRVWRKHIREHEEREIKPVKGLSSEQIDVKFNRILREKRRLIKSKKDRKVSLGLDLGVVHCSRPDRDILFDSLYYQATKDGLKDTKTETAFTDYIRAGMLRLFPQFDDLDEYIERKCKAKWHNLKIRKKRFHRKAHLNEWNYFVTFTFDDEKQTPESFRKKLRKCLSNLHTRRGWRYMGVFEEAPETGRLHFHGLLYIPDGEMLGTLTEKEDYSTAQGKMQTRHENDFFQKAFGRNDFTGISKMQLKYGHTVDYIVKYIGKTGEKIVYSRGIPTEVFMKLTEENIITGFTDYVEKFVLFDNVVDWERDIMHYNRKKQMSIIDLLCNPPRYAA